MGYDINSEPIIRFAYRAGAAALTIALLLVLIILVLRLAASRRERRKIRFIEAWKDHLNESIVIQEGEPLSKWLNSLPGIAPKDAVFFLSYWNRLQGSVRGEARSRLNLIAKKTGMDDAARRLLKKGSEAERLLALVSLGYFSKKEDKDLLLMHVQEEHPLGCLYAVRALIHAYPEKTRDMLRIVAHRMDLSLPAIAGVLQEVGADEASRALAALLLEARRDKAGSEYMVRLIELSMLAHPDEVRRPLCLIMEEAEDPEVIANCIKAMHHPDMLDRIRKLASHPEWKVRVQAATALGDIGEKDDVKLLESMLGDSQWWVRFRSAQAILRLPFLSGADLKALKSGLKDTFAIDVLNQVSSERSDEAAG